MKGWRASSYVSVSTGILFLVIGFALAVERVLLFYGDTLTSKEALTNAGIYSLGILGVFVSILLPFVIVGSILLIIGIVGLYKTKQRSGHGKMAQDAQQDSAEVG